MTTITEASVAYPAVLTLEEAATYLRIRMNLLLKLRKRGEIRAVRLGRRIVVPRQELERYIGDLLKKATDGT